MKNLKRFIPSKMVLYILGLFILGFLAYGVFYYYQQKKPNNKNNQDNLLKVSLVDDSVNSETFLDSDGDGVYDWIERLWPELDPLNPDSDGDGVSDLKYIKQKQLIRDRERLAEGEVFEELTASEKLGRSVYSALYAINQSGGVIDGDTQDKISENIVDYVSDLSLGSKTYIRDELILVENTQSNSYAYRDAMKKFLKKYPIQTSEINLFIKSIQDTDEYKPQLELAAIKYNLYIKELSAMQVPYAIAGRHTQLLNAAGQVEGAIKNLTLEEYDEIIVLSSLVQVRKTLETIIDASTHIEKYFDIIADPKIFDDVIPNSE